MSNNKAKLLFLTLLISGVTLSGCGPRKNNPLVSASKIHQVKTKEKLNSLLNEGNRYSYNTLVSTNPVEGTTESVMGEPTAPTPTPEAGDRDYVGTNLQDRQVDESDIIKTDGNKIYYVSEDTNKMTVFDVLDTHEIVKVQDVIEQNVRFSEMYLLDDYIVLIGQKSNQYIENDYWMPYYHQTSSVFVYDVTTLSKVYSVELNYQITTTRLINRAFYIVGYKYLYNGRDNEVPGASENSANPELLSYEDIYYFDDTLVYGATIIGGIYLDPTPEKITYNAEAYLGAGYYNKAVYANKNNLYISDSSFYYDSNNSYTKLTVSQFTLNNNDASAVFKGVATLKGSALNQFAMDEYNGYLRLATTDNEAQWQKDFDGHILWNSWQAVITNYLYILKLDESNETFNLVGHISAGLGKPNETIRSVRFDGSKGYIVTFLQTDPLYVIDLSNPKAPLITDALFQPGFDTYQHPWSENTLVGLGYDADERGVINGLKISAYNTTSGSASELQTVKVGLSKEEGKGSTTVYSEAAANHKAILVSPSHNIIGFPLYAYTYSLNDYYGMWHHQSEYVVYAIVFTKNTPISELVRISHEQSSSHNNRIRRAVLIEGHIYTFSNINVVTYDIVNNVISENILKF